MQAWHLKSLIHTHLFIFILLQNQLEDKDLRLEDSDKARIAAVMKLIEWEAELKNSKHEISTLSQAVISMLKF